MPVNVALFPYDFVDVRKTTQRNIKTVFFLKFFLTYSGIRFLCTIMEIISKTVKITSFHCFCGFRECGNLNYLISYLEKNKQINADLCFLPIFSLKNRGCKKYVGGVNYASNNGSTYYININCCWVVFLFDSVAAEISIY